MLLVVMHVAATRLLGRIELGVASDRILGLRVALGRCGALPPLFICITSRIYE